MKIPDAAELAAMRADLNKWRGLWGPYPFEIASGFLDSCNCAQCAASIIDSPDKFEVYCHECSERGDAAICALRSDRDLLLELVRRADALFGSGDPSVVLQWIADAGRALGEKR